MKHLLILTLFAAVCIFIAATWLSTPRSASTSAPTPSTTQSGQLYVCPMASDADVLSDKPGQCPKCGMNLVEKK